MTSDPVSRYYTAQDGLRLHMRDYPTASDRTPVVCLPGLARTAADFDPLARALATTRRVVALDYRGRGLSEWDKDWKNYDLGVESADILSVLTAAGIETAVVIGTSRGGIHAMILAAARPTLLRGVVLNDVGPILDPLGLARIKGYVGKLPAPNSWSDAVQLAKSVMGAQFSALDDEDWHAYARLSFEERDGAFHPRYDKQLMRALDIYDPEAPAPDMWPLFEALSTVPVLAIRGENSDLLSTETLAEMAKRHPKFQSFTVPGQGHAPLLIDGPTIEKICQFIEAIP